MIIAMLLALALTAEPVAQLDLKGLSYDEQLTALALQGLVNRAGPRLYLETASVNWPNPAADGWWRDHYTAHKGLAFEPAAGLDAALTRFAAAYRGLVVYDPARDGSRYLALTLAGLDDLLPVTPELLQREPLAARAVVHDLRGRFVSDLEAYGWALEALLPRCRDRAVYSVGRSHDGILLGGDQSVILAADYGVAERVFFFNLSFTDKPADIYGQKIPGYPDQVAMLDRILDHLSPPAAVWGWCEPEGDFARRVSRHGHFVVCGAAPNLSFHHRVPVEPRSLRQKRHAEPHGATLEEKTYVTVLTNEGDTPKAIVSEYLRGWSEPERGQIPVTWLVNPHLLSLFPAVGEMYYDTASANDYFACAVSGAGYTILSGLPGFAGFAEWTAHYLPFADLRCIDVWTDTDDPAALRRYAEKAGAAALTLEGPGPDGVSFSGELPISRTGEGLSYWSFRFKSLEALADEVRRQAEATPRPNFVQIYSGTSPREWLRLAALLGDNYCFVRLDDYLALAGRAALLRLEPPVTYAAPGEQFALHLAARTWEKDEHLAVTPQPAEGVTWEEAPGPLHPQHTVPASASLKGRVAADAAPGRRLLTCTDSRGNQARAYLQVVENGFDDPFDTADGWQGWAGQPAGLEVRDGRALVTDPPGGVPYSAVEKLITLDVDRYPTLLVDVRDCERGLAVKVRPADRQEDIVLLPDTHRGGTLRAELTATGWHGMQRFYLILFVVGEGSTVEFDRVRFVRW